MTSGKQTVIQVTDRRHRSGGFCIVDDEGRFEGRDDFSELAELSGHPSYCKLNAGFLDVRLLDDGPCRRPHLFIEEVGDVLIEL